MEKKKFNPAEWQEDLPAATTKEPAAEVTQPRRQAPANNAWTASLEDQIERITQRIEATATDITVGYERWLTLGFALVDALRENGRDYFHRLLQDEYFDTQLLFRSPSGHGLKWIIPTDLSECGHTDYFRSVATYVLKTYGVEVDQSGKDVCRACFLPWDPDAYLNPVLL